MKKMVVGFAFGPDREEVILIKRTKDDWQKDRLNGLGGHVEPHERPEDAMAREFFEEAGIRAERDLWRELVVLTIRDEYQVTFFAADLPPAFFHRAETSSDEGEIVFVPVMDIHRRALVPPAHWIVPLALDRGIELPLCVKRR